MLTHSRSPQCRRTSSVTESQCEQQSPNCGNPSDVFFDDKPLHHATDPTGLARSAFYLDHAAGRLYLSRNPAGHHVELALASLAFRGW